jgi:hypothetical protein
MAAPQTLEQQIAAAQADFEPLRQQLLAAGPDAPQQLREEVREVRRHLVVLLEQQQQQRAGELPTLGHEVLDLVEYVMLACKRAGNKIFGDMHKIKGQ